MADKGAKLGAKMHPSSPLADARCGRTWQITTLVAKFLARLHTHASDLGHDTTNPRARLKPNKAMFRALRLVMDSSHSLAFEQD
eukprot:118547-Heterocapsa_arctica.AAC.1